MLTSAFAWGCRGRFSVCKRAAAVLLSVIPLSSTGCAPAQPAAAPSSTTEEMLTYTVPHVQAAVVGSETQTKNKLIVAVIPTPFAITDTPVKTCVAAPDQSSSLLGGLITVNNNPNAKKAYTVTTKTGVDFEPKTLSFRITVKNMSDQVMKLDGVYPKLNVNSEDVSLTDNDVKKFNSGVLLPNESKQFTLAAPADWKHNDADAVVTFGLVAMPTDMDKAGNVAQKESFSWTFKAGVETKSSPAKKTVETQMLTPQDAAAANCK